MPELLELLIFLPNKASNVRDLPLGKYIGRFIDDSIGNEIMLNPGKSVKNIGQRVCGYGFCEILNIAISFMIDKNASKYENKCFPDGHIKIPHLWPGQNPPPQATDRD